MAYLIADKSKFKGLCIRFPYYSVNSLYQGLKFVPGSLKRSYLRITYPRCFLRFTGKFFIIAFHLSALNDITHLRFKLAYFRMREGKGAFKQSGILSAELAVWAYRR